MTKHNRITRQHLNQLCQLTAVYWCIYASLILNELSLTKKISVIWVCWVWPVQLNSVVNGSKYTIKSMNWCVVKPENNHKSVMLYYYGVMNIFEKIVNCKAFCDKQHFVTPLLGHRDINSHRSLLGIFLLPRASDCVVNNIFCIKSYRVLFSFIVLIVEGGQALLIVERVVLTLHWTGTHKISEAETRKDASYSGRKFISTSS